MRIMLRDGSVFQGSAIEIVAGMRRRARAEHLAVADFVGWFARSLEIVSGLDLEVKGEGDEERAETFLRTLLAKGLAVEERLHWR